MTLDFGCQQAAAIPPDAFTTALHQHHDPVRPRTPRPVVHGRLSVGMHRSQSSGSTSMPTTSRQLVIGADIAMLRRPRGDRPNDSLSMTLVSMAGDVVPFFP